ncbi:MAG: hypothetical protein ABI846_11680 [Rudaea sp.]
MHFLRAVVPLLLALCSTIGSAAPYSTEFAVSPEATSIRTLARLHRGDRVQVQSPRLLGNEIVLLVECLNGCAKTKIIRGWSGRRNAARKGSDLLERVTILQDGDYLIAAHEIPTTVEPITLRGCIRSLPLHVLCGDARPLRITESKADGEWFRARLSSSSWLWVRYTRR